MLDKENIKKRTEYSYFDEVGTRFGDNEIFGHVNNVIYYSLFDTVINRFLIINCGYSPGKSSVVGVSPETRCIFRRSFEYPEIIDAGLKVKKIGDSSVVYDISLFKKDENEALAEGHFVHVFVERENMQNVVKIPVYIRDKLETLNIKKY